MLQFAENVRLEVDLNVSSTSPRSLMRRADLNDFTAQRQLRAVIEEGFRLVADVPFQIENDQIHRSGLLIQNKLFHCQPTPSWSLSAVR